jgi:hypothetical protein
VTGPVRFGGGQTARRFSALELLDVMPAAKTVEARQQIVAEVDAHTVVVLKGARFRSTHPVVKDNPGQFGPVKRRP